ncbi:DUF1223 domain-containing protein [Consotaella salsifontis]|uniref:DUF1223 domain-containing protein n=1 Tax=Consotaella salsifontis TaxID=1365950 RepID=UPI0013F67315|nr:DUF1223 domain-containing protein [Consotaella salsifontis]
MRAKTGLLILGASLLACGNALAQRATTVADSTMFSGVVELFTAQGCSSCPPADALFAEFSRKENLVTLAYHVDYWDYIGWRDTFASPQTTDRQRDYAKAFKTATVYTPQAVVNGRRQVVGSKRKKIEDALASTHLGSVAEAPRLQLEIIGDRLHIRADGAAARSGQNTLLILATYEEEVKVAVKHGENAGRTLLNSHPVRDWRVLGMWAGKPMEIDIPIVSLVDDDGGKTGCAALLQEVGPAGAPGPIVAAVALSLLK